MQHEGLTSWHYHKSQQGVLVVHSHPFSPDSSDTPIQHHPHNLSDYIIAYYLDQILVFIGLLGLLAILLAAKPVFYLLIRRRFLSQVIPRQAYLRGPPESTQALLPNS